MELTFNYTPELFLLFISTWSIALFLFYAWRKTGEPLLVYAHFTFLFAPLLIYAVQLSCSWDWIASLLQWCSIMWTKLLIYLIPAIVLVAIIIGYFMMPRLYTKHLKAKRCYCMLIENTAKKFKLNLPHVPLYVVDTMKPIGFSIRNSIFISIGMFELLTRKQLEAVFLHEFYHIKEGSSWKKFSTALARFITPLAAFSVPNHSISNEEQLADAFAAKVQGTNRYVLQAKEKIVEYENLFKR